MTPPEHGSQGRPATLAAPPQAEVSEVFSSLQGEGIYLGKPQVFVRFGRCNMHCRYCDEVAKMQPSAYRREALETLLGRIDTLESSEGPHHAVSLTGGEPLIYTAFLEHFLPELKARGYRTYLETNGTLPRALERVIKDTDIVAMDLKLPSTTGDRSFWKEHEEFLRLAREREVFVKTVVTADVCEEEVYRAVELVRETDASIPFIFQPESEVTGISLAAVRRIKRVFWAYAEKRLSDVRVVPQMHKIWEIP